MYTSSSQQEYFINIVFKDKDSPSLFFQNNKNSILICIDNFGHENLKDLERKIIQDIKQKRNEKDVLFIKSSLPPFSVSVIYKGVSSSIEMEKIKQEWQEVLPSNTKGNISFYEFHNMDLNIHGDVYQFGKEFMKVQNSKKELKDNINKSNHIKNKYKI